MDRIDRHGVSSDTVAATRSVIAAGFSHLVRAALEWSPCHPAPRAARRPTPSTGTGHRWPRPRRSTGGSRTRSPSTDHDHHVLIEPHEDRWRWRRKIRQNPRKLAFYRVAVAIAGLLLICLGFVSGPLPGPGGIPLVLLGLAIWSSEFEWAHRLMSWFKAQLKRFRAWPRRGAGAVLGGLLRRCGLLGYSYMLLIGVPGWLPASARDDCCCDCPASVGRRAVRGRARVAHNEPMRAADVRVLR